MPESRLEAPGPVFHFSNCEMELDALFDVNAAPQCRTHVRRIFCLQVIAREIGEFPPSGCLTTVERGSRPKRLRSRASVANRFLSTAATEPNATIAGML